MDLTKNGRVIRLTEASPAAMAELQQRYACLLADYIKLAETHVETIKRYHDLLDRHLSRVTVTL